MTEMEDGSAVVELDMSPDEMRSLLEYAVCMGLVEGLKLLQKQKLLQQQKLLQIKFLQIKFQNQIIKVQNQIIKSQKQIIKNQIIKK